MSQLIQLRRKIKSFSSTKKITYAMRLTSWSLYSRLEKQNVTLAYYKEKIEEVFKTLSQGTTNWKNNILFPKDILNSRPLVIVVASSKGLCGSFNSNLIRYMQQHFILEEHQSPTLITVGLKASNYAKQQKLKNIIANYDEFNSNNYQHISEDIIEIINDPKNQFSSVIFFSNFFKNFFVQRPAQTQMIPLQIEESDEQTNNKKDIIAEQDLNKIMDYLSIRYLTSLTTNLLFQSILSEQAARFLAMDAATTNADKLIEALTLRYNKARQALITKELAELTASFSKTES